MEYHTPNRRRFANPLALAVLVHLYEQPRHPYELSTTLRERRKEQSIKLNYGSLYAVFEALARDKYIRALETSREGNRPEKTVYEITPDGQQFMLEWMREIVSLPVKEYPQFEAALSLLPVLPPGEVITLLETRLRILKKNLEAIDEAKQEEQLLKLPRLFSIEGEFYETMVTAECKFVQAFLKDLQADTGQITTTWKKGHAALWGKDQPIKTKPKKATHQKKKNV